MRKRGFKLIPQLRNEDIKVVIDDKTRYLLFVILSKGLCDFLLNEEMHLYFISTLFR